jgi:hypothetical protein
MATKTKKKTAKKKVVKKNLNHKDAEAHGATAPLFLVTTEGERHEDHIPEAFMTFSQLKKSFPFSPTMMRLRSGEKVPATEENMVNSNGNWCEIICLNVDDNEFTSEEISYYMANGDLPYRNFDLLDAPEIVRYVIHISPNKKIPHT